MKSDESGAAAVAPEGSMTSKRPGPSRQYVRMLQGKLTSERYAAIIRRYFKMIAAGVFDR